MAQTLQRSNWPLRVVLWLGVVGLGVAAIVTTADAALLPVLAGAAAVVAVSALLARPELGVLAFAVMLYANAPVNLGRLAGSPQALGIAVTLLLLVSVLVEVYVHRRGWVVDYGFMAILAFVGLALLSTVLSRHPGTSLGWTLTLVTEGALVYLLVINAVRRIDGLKRILWALLCVSALSSALSAYQDFTGSYEQTFLGLARRNTERGLGEGATSADGLIRERTSLHPVYRAHGPIGDPNRFGQALLVLMPFGLLFMKRSRRSRERWIAAALSGVVLVGMFLTYSRGTLVMLALCTFLMVLLGILRAREVALGVVAGVVLVAVAAPGTVKRLDSIRGVEGLMTAETDAEADGAIRGRTTEMLAALNAFRDHPVLGVGPGNYMPHYSVEYMANPEIAFRIRTTQRRAHSLYLELAAEMGVVGLLGFMAIPTWLGLRLWFLRRRWLHVDRERALLATAFLIALVAYFGTAIFLHLAFQRYYWLLLGLAGATVQLLSQRRNVARPLR